MRAARRHALWEPGSTTRATALGRAEIERILPHRGPALMLDEISAIDLDQRCLRAGRIVNADDPAFDGHFPGEPVYPAFLQCEIAGQAGLCLLDFLRRDALDIPADCRPRAVRPVKLHQGVLVSEVRPGDSLTAMAKVIEDDALTSVFAAQLLRDGTVCSAIIVEVYFVGP